MARYFHIMSGLRGCYMPDSCNVIKCDTRRELKAAIEDEVRYHIHDCGFNGGDKKTIAWAAAKAWRDKVVILPYGPKDQRPYSIEICVATRAEWLEFEGSHV